MQIQAPRNFHVWQAIGSDREFVAPLIVAVIRVKEKLQPRASLKGHFLQSNKTATFLPSNNTRWQHIRNTHQGYKCHHSPFALHHVKFQLLLMQTSKATFYRVCPDQFCLLQLPVAPQELFHTPVTLNPVTEDASNWIGNLLPAKA